MNWNDGGAQSGVIEVIKEMRLIRYDVASMGETSVHILDEVVLIKCRLFSGGMIEAHLLEAEGVTFDAAVPANIFRRRLHVKINIVMLSDKVEKDKERYRNQQ